jgi:hypothetical protein
MKTMRPQRVALPLALLSAAFLLGCQEQASGPVEPDGLAPRFTHKDPDKVHGGPKGGGGGGGGGGGNGGTWSFADARVHGASVFVTDKTNTLQSNTTSSLPPDCAGFPGAQPSKPSVVWNDEPDGEMNGSTDGCAQVTTIGKGLEPPATLTNDASLIVTTKTGSTKFTIQFQIQNIGGPDGIQYRTDRFVITNPLNLLPFDGAGYRLHVDTTVTIYRLKGHTGGPKVADVGTIDIGDIVYR